MSNKQLTAKVRINSTQAEQKLRSLSKTIDAINRAVGKQSSAYNTVNNALKQSTQSTAKVKSETDKWANATNKANKNLRSSNSILNSIGGKLKTLAATYLGVMGAKAVIGVSDTITSAQNKLNYVNAQQLGSKAYNADGTYSNATLKASQNSLDKMYASSQKVRMSYTDMMSNVSKSMALAGDSFGGSIDNAIRFQEIMAEAYTVGGASAQEMHSSMYQMIQALGSGTLAGDELRSVREGAPLAYQAIEDFVQGVYNTEESLKDLASQGKVTSDMVVSAIMNSGNSMDKAFAQTAQTFDQTWTQIKNAALRAFEPVSNMLRDALNKAVDNGMIQRIEKVFEGLSKAFQVLFKVIASGISWITDNWSWLKYVFIAVMTAMVAYLLYVTTINVTTALIRIGMWIAEHAVLLGIILIIGALVAALVWLANTTVDGCEFMCKALLMVATALLLIGIITVNVKLLIIAGLIALAVLFITFAQEIVGGVYWIGAVCYNVAMGIANFFIACWNWVCAAGYNAFAGIVNFAMGLWNSIQAIADNIGIAFQNAWIWAKNTFWEFVADVLDGLSKLEPVINGIASLLGKDSIDFGELTSSIRSKKQEYKDYVSVSAAWNSGMNTMQYKDAAAAWNSGINTYDYKDLSEAYANGAQVGANIQNKVGEWGSSVKNLLNGNTINSKLKNSSFPNSNDPAYSVANAYNMPTNDELINGVGDINDNTSDMKDAMELSNDDLDYLRRIAEMEWRNEFTTAEIKVEMNNNNTVTSDRDLDGIVEYLSDTLRSEMTNVAYGVHY